MIGIGVIGAGVMGADHARFLSSSVQDAALVAIADADRSRAEAAAGKVAGCRVLTDGYAIIRASEVDAVLIASPDATHHDLVLACLAAGKPVLCEKPLAPSAEECLEICTAEMKGGKRLIQVGFMRRFDPSYTAMKQEMDTRAYGRPVMLHCVHRNAVVPPWFDEKMLITNSAVHEFDISRWLLGQEIRSIETFPKAAKGSQEFRNRRLIVMETENDIVIDVEVFMNAQYGYDVRAEMVCQSGTIALAPKAEVQVRKETQERFGFAPDWRGHFADAYRIELQAWTKSIATRQPVGASAWDGYAATVIADAGVRAGEIGDRVNISLEKCPSFYG